MRISLNWLKEYIDIDLPVDDLAHEMTMLGLEIEAIERPGAGIENVLVGHIVSIDPHPDADKLVVCRTDVGQGEPLQIVCGAKNMKAGDKVPTAIVGATLPGDFTIGRRKMRGVESFGMMCSARELGMGEDHHGLLILDPAAPVGTDVRKVLGLDDVIVEVEITPNRGDWAGMIGVARELAAHLRRPYRRPTLALPESATPAAEVSSVTIQDPDLCPRYCGRVIRGVKIGPSPAWLSQRLTAAGVRSINNVVDVTNYVLMETGHPLHAFDLDKLEDKLIVVRRARAGETIKTIDGEVRPLKDDMLVIADSQRPVAVAGVMGGLESEVGEETANIFLESAYFLPASVRKTSRALALISEASQRFQRGADPEMLVYALDRAAELIQALAGGEILSGKLDEYPKPLKQNEVTLRYSRAQLLLGSDVPHDEQRDILKSLGFEILGETAEGMTVRVPTWRHDVSLEADLIEEVARLHGYGQIPTTVPQVKPTERVFAPEEEALQRLRDYLVSMGLVEMMTWTFSSLDAVRKTKLPEPYLNAVALQNPLAETLSIMRPSLLPGLLNVAAENIRRGSRNIHAFEVGPVFEAVAGEELPRQTPHLAVLLTGFSGEKHWSAPQRSLDFYDLKGDAEGIMELFGLPHTLQPSTFPVFEAGQAGEIVAGGLVVGCLGRVRAEVLKAYDIDQPVFLFELELSTLLGHEAPPATFADIPKFPPSLRDLAVVVSADVPAGDIRQKAKNAGGKLLRRVNIFDVYTGKQVAPGKKSVALSLVFQSEERTLTDADTKQAEAQILSELQKAYGAELR